jgi:hypothetical protein
MINTIVNIKFIGIWEVTACSMVDNLGPIFSKKKKAYSPMLTLEIIIMIIQFFIIYVLNQQPKWQLQRQQSVETGNYIIDKYNIKTKQITGKQWRKKKNNCK